MLNSICLQKFFLFTYFYLIFFNLFFVASTYNIRGFFNYLLFIVIVYLSYSKQNGFFLSLASQFLKSKKIIFNLSQMYVFYKS